MNTKRLTLRYSPDLGAIDDTPLLDLGRDHEILGIREHFFVAQDLPHLLYIVTCRRRQRPATASERPKVLEPERSAEIQTPPATKRASSGPPSDFDDDQIEIHQPRNPS